MKWFPCACRARVFFDNSRCLSCQRELGFFPTLGRLAALAPSGPDTFTAVAHPRLHRKCQNYGELGVCNWMVPCDDESPLCLACRLTEVIPDQSDAANREKWARMEAAKRRLVYSLLRLGLPVIPKSAEPELGLAFEIKSDTASERVITGHENGRITLNLAEADPVLREKTRVAMNERYRTLLGHFRHEIGHYYWDLLLQDEPGLTAFRALFGDERQDYSEALQRHYAAGRGDWLGDFVSAYASSHPWEDWAETFAHYLHVVDTLETASAFGVNLGERSDQADAKSAFPELMARFVELTLVLNALNRSMGLEDAYPFQIGERAAAKLAFVHDVVQRRSRHTELASG